MKLFFRVIASAVCLNMFAHVACAAEDATAIEQRIKPVGQVTIAAPAAAAAPGEAAGQSGEKVFQTYCTTCHTAGVAGAPKVGDKAAWAPRIKQGESVLLKHAVGGLRAMPPKGTCMQCTDSEIKSAIEYMIEKSK